MSSPRLFESRKDAFGLRDKVCRNLCVKGSGVVGVGLRKLRRAKGMTGVGVVAFLEDDAERVSEYAEQGLIVERLSGHGLAVAPGSQLSFVDKKTGTTTVNGFNYGGVVKISGVSYLLTAGHIMTPHQGNGGEVQHSATSTLLAKLDGKSFVLSPELSNAFDLAALAIEDPIVFRPLGLCSKGPFFMARFQGKTPEGGSEHATDACFAMSYVSGCKLVDNLVVVSGADFGEMGNSGAMIYSVSKSKCKPFALTIGWAESVPPSGKTLALAHPVARINKILGWTF